MATSKSVEWTRLKAIDHDLHSDSGQCSCDFDRFWWQIDWTSIERISRCKTGSFRSIDYWRIFSLFRKSSKNHIPMSISVRILRVFLHRCLRQPTPISIYCRTKFQGYCSTTFTRFYRYNLRIGYDFQWKWSNYRSEAMIEKCARSNAWPSFRSIRSIEKVSFNVFSTREECRQHVKHRSSFNGWETNDFSGRNIFQK